MIKATIFDFDDTLVQTKKSKWKAFKTIGKQIYNLDITNEHIERFWGQPYPKMIQGIFQKVDTLERLRHNYEQIRSQFPMEAHSDALVVLEKLLKSYEVGILSASSRGLVLDDFKLLQFPIKKFFFIQTSEDTSVHKPDPKVFEPILAILKTKQIAKDETIYIGDSLNDYKAATGAGIKFCGIAHDIKSKNLFKKQNIQTVSSFNELPSLILSF